LIGKKISHYSVTAKLGEGGMGEVYRATDSRLGRDVALKVLPEAFATDAERMARFEREAHLLASLNHSNIATIHGLEEADGVRCLVLELVEGPTLADRIAQGPIALEEALPIAKQITEALEYAHEHGVIHRDLKPANIKVTPEGTVKILDFGLAKAFEDEVPQEEIAKSPTLTAMATQAGIILGTAAYMSPEQAKGKKVDRRGDIWAFGVVLFEMLTGKQLYQGETVSETMAAVMLTKPDWDALPATTPVPIRELLRRCLEKDSRRRLQAIGEARITIEALLTDPTAADTAAASAVPPTASSWRRALPWALAGLLTLALAASLGRGPVHETPATKPPARFIVTLAESERLEVATAQAVAVSADGTKMVAQTRSFRPMASGSASLPTPS
jgi:serine/threonine-protein kinase